MKRFGQEFTKVADFQSLWDCCEYVSLKLWGKFGAGMLYQKCVNEPLRIFNTQGVLFEGEFAKYIIKGSGACTGLWICVD